MTQLKNVGSMCCLTFAITGGSFNQDFLLLNLWLTLISLATRAAISSLVPLDSGHLKVKKNKGNTKILEGISAYFTLNHKPLY